MDVEPRHGSGAQFQNRWTFQQSLGALRWNAQEPVQLTYQTDRLSGIHCSCSNKATKAQPSNRKCSIQPCLTVVISCCNAKSSGRSQQSDFSVWAPDSATSLRHAWRALGRQAQQLHKFKDSLLRDQAERLPPAFDDSSVFVHDPSEPRSWTRPP